jgi:hypothetical protein
MHPLHSHYMQTILSDFEWFRHAAGYRLVNRQSLPGGQPPMDRIVANSNDRQPYQVDKIDVLYKHFAAIYTPDKLLDFANHFGPLTDGGPDYYLDDPGYLDEEGFVGMRVSGPYEGESVSECLNRAKMFRTLMNYRDKGRQSLAKYFRSPQYRHSDNLGPLGNVVLEPDASGEVHLRIVPHNLWQALQLQLGQVLAGERNFRPCRYCGQWFECGVGTAKRGDAKFCSDDHRITFNSLKRSKEPEK